MYCFILKHAYSDPETTEDERANGTDLAHFPMVESDTETIIPDLGSRFGSRNVIPCPYFDPTSEEIGLETFLDKCPNSVSALVPDPVPALVPNPIPEVCPSAVLGSKENQPQK